MTSEPKDLITVKKLAELTGASDRFIVQLMEEGRLRRWKINTATYVSRVEFESIAVPVTKETVGAYMLGLGYTNKKEKTS